MFGHHTTKCQVKMTAELKGLQLTATGFGVKILSKCRHCTDESRQLKLSLSLTNFSSCSNWTVIVWDLNNVGKWTIPYETITIFLTALIFKQI